MRRAFRLACLGAGRTSPNPLVGAVVVRDGRIVGEGTHIYSERWHAERVALQRAGARAAGADLYVTLEPCCHHGRTPPCVEAILEADIRRVFCGCTDPNPAVAGKGLARLRETGVEVVLAPDPRPFQLLNRAFAKSITRGLPWVTLKAAVTLDGRIAPASGISRWITAEKARDLSQFLRFLCDAILVGAGTVIMDNPLLTCRYRRERQRPLLRVVLDPLLSMPETSQLVRTAAREPLLVYAGEAADAGQMSVLGEQGVKVVRVPHGETGLDLRAVLTDLGSRGITSLLVEGGGQVLTSFVREEQADEFFFMYGPRFLGAGSIPLLGDLGRPELSEAPRVIIDRVKPVGTDALIHGFFGDPGGMFSAISPAP